VSATAAERLAETVGPIVVKEVRQGLRTRAFGVAFALLLTCCLVAALIAAAEFDRRGGAQLGPKYFRAFLWALAVVEFFVIPYTAYRSTAREREDETWVLLVLTGLTPRRIVRGKVSSGLAQGLLFASACAPFVLFSYYLNGVDLPTVLVALTMAGAWSGVLICLSVAFATLGDARFGRALAHFVVLSLLFAATLAGIGFTVFLSESNGGLLRSDRAIWALCFGQVLWCVSTGVLLIEGAAAGLSLSSENAARGPRLVLTGQVLLGLAFSALVLAVFDHVGEFAPVLGSTGTSLQLLACGVFALSERDGYRPIFAREKHLLKPGAVRSFVLVIGLLAVSTAVWVALSRITHPSTRHFRLLLAAPMYVALYLSLGVIIGRLSWLRQAGEPSATRTGLLVALMLGIVVPMFVAVLAGRRADDRDFNIFNPFIGVDAINAGSRGRDILVMLAAAALLSVFSAWSVLSSRDSERRA
jgi:hypothetical protein